MFDGELTFFFGIPQDDSHAMLRTRWCLCGLRRDAVDPVRGRWSQPPKSPEMGGRNHRQVLGLWRCVSHSKNTLFSSSDPRPDPLFRHSFWHIPPGSHCFWHILWHFFWHSIWHLFWHSFWHIFWHSSWHSIWQTFFLAFYLVNLRRFFVF